MTDRICIHSNGENKFRLSAEDLLTCCDSCGFGCNGGYPESAWQFFVSDGIVTGGAYGTHRGMLCSVNGYPWFKIVDRLAFILILVRKK